MYVPLACRHEIFFTISATRTLLIHHLEYQCDSVHYGYALVKRQLRLEINGTNGGNVPNDLCDDPEKDGLASRRTYGNWVVAMYHPTTYPDHFITYNANTGCWIRWELNNGNPLIFRQSR